MHRRTPLLILFAGLVVAGYELPDFRRRLPERPTNPGCSYQGSWYAEGARVDTPEPCLNCTCVRALLVCYLRVCPSAPAPPGCLAARTPGQCCPQFICGGDEQPSAAPEPRPTFQPSTPDDSPLYITSDEQQEADLDHIPGGCLVNGTLYGDGSAMLSSSFCEYCFCIRGKTTCLEPKCHLDIEGCTPHFDSHFACCPSRYDCGSNGSLTLPGTTLPPKDTLLSNSPEGDCVVGNEVYHPGEQVPEMRDCHTCYCSESGVVCERIDCNPDIPGCEPIIPNGYCCPISYRCDHYNGDSGNNNKTNQLNNIKGNMKIADLDGRNSEFSHKKSHVNMISKSEKSGKVFQNYFPAYNRMDDNIESVSSMHPIKADITTDFASENQSDSITMMHMFNVQSSSQEGENEENLHLVLNLTTETSVSYKEPQTPQPLSDVLETTTANNYQTLSDLLETTTATNSQTLSDLLQTTTETNYQTLSDLLETTATATNSQTLSDLSDTTTATNSQTLSDLLETTTATNTQTLSDLLETTTATNSQTLSDLSERTTATNSQTLSDLLETTTATNTQTLSDLLETTTATNTQTLLDLLETTTENIELHAKDTILVGDPEVHTMPIQDLIGPLFSPYADASNVSAEINLQTQRNNSKQPSQFNGSSWDTELNETLSTTHSILLKDQATVEKSHSSFTTSNETFVPETTTYDFGLIANDTTVTIDVSTTSNELNQFFDSENNQINKSALRVTIPNHYLRNEKPANEQSNVPGNARGSERINSKIPQSLFAENIIKNSSLAKLSSNESVEDTLSEDLDGKFAEDLTNKTEDVAIVDKGGPLLFQGFNERRKDIVGIGSLNPKNTDIKPQLILNGHQDASTRQVLHGETLSDASERRKEPRIQENPNQGAAQNYKIIPFVAKDAVTGLYGKGNGTLLALQDGSLPDMVSDFCFINGRIYVNGEMVVKTDPCEVCRCVYGQELCQIQRCPTPPDCQAEIVPGFCCPRFTCAREPSLDEQRKAHNATIQSVGISKIPTFPDKPVTEKAALKFGVRVRIRSTTTEAVPRTTPQPRQRVPIRTTTTEAVTRTTPHSREPVSIRSTTTEAVPKTTPHSREPVSIRSTTTEAAPETTPHSRESASPSRSTTPPVADPWGLLQVSGCNIYGKFFKINDQVEILSGPCSHCICKINGVECNDIC